MQINLDVMQEKKLKIQKADRLKVNRKYDFFPKIILQGKWLEKAGFAIGEFAKITVTDTIINIVKLDKYAK